jgi:hypothetical protein
VGLASRIRRCPQVTGRLVAYCALGTAALGAGACASSSKAQLASTQLSAVLSELRAATTTFRTSYVAEIDRTRTELARAFIARSINNQIRDLSKHFDEPEWIARFRHTGLIALSEEIEAARKAAQQMIRETDTLTLREEETGADGLARLAKAQAAALRATAEQLKSQEQTEAAEELFARADRLEARPQEAIPDDRLRAYLESYIELGAMKREAPRNLRQLVTLVTVLQETHAVVHEWVMTDVKISGAAVAALLTKHAATLDPGATSEGTQ